jgi:glyoxylase-like metal-dependent hydrolase (beta-lactamase superfamily II)
MPTTITVGNARITSLTDTEEPTPPADIYAQVKPSAFEPYRGLLQPDGQLLMNFSCYLVEVDGRNILIDTAWGPPHNGRLMEDIAAAGIKPEAIDIVTFTHLHIDHYGWNLVKEATGWKPRFPNARYVVNQIDWDYFYTNFPREERAEEAEAFDVTMTPLRDLGVMDLFTGNHVFSPSVIGEHTPGHTLGHMSFVVSSGGEKCYMLGDVAISPIDAQNTNWKTVYDEAQDLAVKTRYDVLDRIESESTLVAANHFPKPGYGRFVRVDGRRTWKAEM